MGCPECINELLGWAVGQPGLMATIIGDSITATNPAQADVVQVVQLE